MRHYFFTSPILPALILCASMLLCSCAPSHFDCPLMGGVSCQSLEQINTRIDAGSLPLFALALLPQGEKKEC